MLITRTAGHGAGEIPTLIIHEAVHHRMERKGAE